MYDYSYYYTISGKRIKSQCIPYVITFIKAELNYCFLLPLKLCQSIEIENVLHTYIGHAALGMYDYCVTCSYSTDVTTCVVMMLFSW